MRYCSICGKEVNEEESLILAMGGFGNPKYLCSVCAKHIDTATESTDPVEIELAMAKISDSLSATAVEDPLVAKTIKEIFAAAGERAKKIKDGTYNFSEDEKSEEELLDVPEELLETEEDKALDEKDAKTSKILDKIFNWIYFAIFVVAIFFIIVYFFVK